MFKLGDKVVVTSADSKSKADYIGEVDTIRDVVGGRYKFVLPSRGVYVGYNPTWSDDELRLATTEDLIEHLRREVVKDYIELDKRIILINGDSPKDTDTTKDTDIIISRREFVGVLVIISIAFVLVAALGMLMS